MAGRGSVTVVGSGPNGLAAAVAMAGAGHGVTVYEAADVPGGGTRTEALTLPGYLHDVCSAVHPMAASSPFFRTLPLAGHGLAWVQPPIPLAHPFDDGPPAILHRSLADTAEGLGPDGTGWRRLLEPFVHRWDAVMEEVLAPPLHLPRHPLLLARFGALGLRSATGLAGRAFRTDRARALFAGIAGHGMLPLDRSPSAAFGLVLALAGHAVGWPMARGGSRAVAVALAGVLRDRGGRVVTGHRVGSLDDLPPSAATFLDLTPGQVLDVAGRRLPGRYRRALGRYRYGPGVFKIDWALSEPIPWKDPVCSRAGTVHLAGEAAEVARSIRKAWDGEPDDRPYVILSQPSLFDPSRAPERRHVAWAYCHVPHGAERDGTAALERQIERFAPGFGDVVLARRTFTARQMEAHDPNLVGGAITGGAQDLRQLFFRPVVRLDPYRTPVPGLFLCSASTPPGGGVHGMCGANAARSALRTRP